jgi:hypothetical protein
LSQSQALILYFLETPLLNKVKWKTKPTQHPIVAAAMDVARLRKRAIPSKSGFLLPSYLRQWPL